MARNLHFSPAGNEVLKISILESTGDAVTLQLEGQLVSKWVELLQLTSEDYLHRDSKLSLDLAKLAFADRDGVSLLRNLVGRQVTLLNASPFIAQQIEPPAK